MKLVGVVATALLVAAAALSTGCPNEARNQSITAANEGAKAYGLKQYDTAISSYKRATDKWSENHVAWYGLGGAFSGKQDWGSASDAMGRAVALAPEQGMYQLLYGLFLYEKAVKGAKEQQATKDGKRPEEVTVDLSTINFEKALQHLKEAIKLNNELWRAHYYIGRIYRDTGKSKEAAEEFTRALQSAPTEPGPWVALAELYHQWDYPEQAIQVAEAGVAVVPGNHEKSDIWYEVGMGYDAKRLEDKAIDAFSKALEARRDNHKAKFQRGQSYFRKGDYTNAKRDLEEFSKAGGASVEFAKQQASKMLIDIAAKSVLPGSTPIDEPPPPPAKKGRR